MQKNVVFNVGSQVIRRLQYKDTGQKKSQKPIRSQIQMADVQMYQEASENRCRGTQTKGHKKKSRLANRSEGVGKNQRSKQRVSLAISQ